MHQRRIAGRRNSTSTFATPAFFISIAAIGRPPESTRFTNSVMLGSCPTTMMASLSLWRLSSALNCSNVASGRSATSSMTFVAQLSGHDRGRLYRPSQRAGDDHIDGDADVGQRASYVVGLYFPDLVDRTFLIFFRTAEVLLPCICVPQEINDHFGIVHQKLQTGYCRSSRESWDGIGRVVGAHLELFAGVR